MGRAAETGVADAAARAAAALRAGSSLDHVLRAFREHDRLGVISSITALRSIETNEGRVEVAFHHAITRRILDLELLERLISEGRRLAETEAVQE